MNQNYVRTATSGQVFYTSPESNVNCLNGVSVSASQKLFDFTYQKELKDKKYSERRVYKGCDRQVGFTEIYRVEGVESEVHTDQDIVDGKMDFEVTDKVNSLIYQLTDQEGSAVFEMFFKRVGNKTTLILKITGNTIITRVVSRVGDKTFIAYSPTAFSIKFEANGYSVNASQRTVSPAVRAYIDKLNTFYYDPLQNKISMADFQKMFDFGNLPSMMIAGLLAEFPPTEFVRTGNFNVQLLQELREIQTFLISGTNSNLIRARIEEYIKAAEEGSLVDNR